ncbi:hypothetical protein AAVH_26385 [Aphelenchoides avenae]|nr:hypothetical protein AAVH_26385 [Aphelenchus avenae]
MFKSAFLLILIVAFSSQRVAAQNPPPCHCDNVLEGICTTAAENPACNEACGAMSPGFCVAQPASAHNGNAATCVCSGTGAGLYDELVVIKYDELVVTQYDLQYDFDHDDRASGTVRYQRLPPLPSLPQPYM